MFSEAFDDCLNIRKQCIWIKGGQEKEVILSIINTLIDFGTDRIFTSDVSPFPIQEIIVEKENNSYLKKTINYRNFNLFYKEVLQDNNDSELEDTLFNDEDDYAVIFRDFDLYADNPNYIRMIKEITEINQRKYIPLIFTSEKYEPPAKLEHLFSVIQYENPTIEEITNLLNNYEQKNKITIDNKDIVSNKFLGFSKSEIIEILNLSFYKYKCLDINILNDKKIELINKTNIIDYKKPVFKLEDIGGNNNFKKWFEEIKICMSDEATKYNIDKPKGYLALGIAGCSKSIMAEAIASELQVPLLKLNMSKILSKFVGESERKIEQAINLIKACAPCVLLIDEVEKNLGGYASSNASDSGTLSRVFGKILDLLVENNNGIFTVMTSNNVKDLPPELTRAGRLDAIWYFSLPALEEREDIFKIHFKKRNQEIPDDIIKYISKETNGYTGAEIEQIVKSSLKKAYVNKIKNNKDFEISKSILNEAKEDVIPISKSSKEKISSLEKWAKGRALFSYKNNNNRSSIDLDDIDLDDIKL